MTSQRNPILDPNGQNLYPFQKKKHSKPIQIHKRGLRDLKVMFSERIKYIKGIRGTTKDSLIVLIYSAMWMHVDVYMQYLPTRMSALFIISLIVLIYSAMWMHVDVYMQYLPTRMSALFIIFLDSLDLLCYVDACRCDMQYLPTRMSALFIIMQYLPTRMSALFIIFLDSLDLLCYVDACRCVHAVPAYENVSSIYYFP